MNIIATNAQLSDEPVVNLKRKTIFRIFVGKAKTLSITVNVVIFAGGDFRENVGKTFHVGVIFTILLLFPS